MFDSLTYIYSLRDAGLLGRRVSLPGSFADLPGNRLFKKCPIQRCIYMASILEESNDINGVKAGDIFIFIAL